jgi:hypothetical protein
MGRGGRQGGQPPTTNQQLLTNRHRRETLVETVQYSLYKGFR